MKETINIQCPMCGEYIPSTSKICSYCNENIEKDIIVSNSEELETIECNKDLELNKFNKFTIKTKTILIVFFILLSVIIAFITCYFLLNHFNPQIEIFDSSSMQTKEIKSNSVNIDSSKNINNAKYLFAKEEYDKAAELFQKEIDKSNNAVAIYYLAEIYNNRGYINLAIKTYKKAADQKKNFFEPKKRLAEIYFSQNNYDLAKKYGEEAVLINSKDVDLLYLMINIYYYNGEYDKIVDIHKKIVFADKKNYDSNVFLANYYRNRNDYKKAIPYIENLMNIKYDTNIAYTLAACYAQIEYYTKAIQVLDKIIQNDPYEASTATYYKSNVKNMREYYNFIHSTK